MIQDHLHTHRPSNDDRLLNRVIDGLTQILNREGFEHRLDTEIQRMKAAKHGLGLILFDVERLTAFNKAYGHVAGDALLSAVAKQARDMIGGEDTVARYSGHEFALIIHASSRTAAQKTAGDLCSRIADTRWTPDTLLRPEARISIDAFHDTGSPAHRNYRSGMEHLFNGKLDEATHLFEQTLAEDANHVPAVMELAYMKLRQTLQPQDMPMKVGVHTGVAWYKAGDTRETLCRCAEQALRRVKRRRSV